MQSRKSSCSNKLIHGDGVNVLNISIVGKNKVFDGGPMAKRKCVVDAHSC